MGYHFVPQDVGLKQWHSATTMQARLWLSTCSQGWQGPGFCYLAGTDFAGDRLSTLRVGLREKRRAAARRFMGIVDRVLGCCAMNYRCCRRLLFI